MPQDINELLTQVWSLWQVQFTVYHIGLNVMVALAAAIKTGNFELHRLGEFLYKKLLKNLLIFIAAKLFGDALGYDHLATAAWGLIETELLTDLAGNLKWLGLPIPDSISELIKWEYDMERVDG